MYKLLKVGTKALGLVEQYPRSLYQGFKNRKLFENVERYCMFIGYPRSGHSLIGSLLDAHPNMIISHELDALMHVYAGFSKRQIYYLLLKNSQTFTKSGRKWGSYSYEVPNQWQGRYKKIQIIGDKRAEGSTLKLRGRPWLLRRLYGTIGIRIKFLHVIRNPYDNISTLCKKAKIHGLNSTLMDSIEHYFSLCETVVDIKKQIDSSDILDLKHESFIDNPETYIKRLCHFLGVDAPNDYLNDCASIVFKSPHKSRCDTKWSRELIDNVKNRMDKFPFLDGYSYEE